MGKAWLGLVGGLAVILSGALLAWLVQTAGGVSVRDVRFAGDLARSRMILDVTAKVEMRVFTLADPYRVVVDIAGLDFRITVIPALAAPGLFNTAFRRWRSRLPHSQTFW